MPELPEVETIRRQLAPLVQGRTLQALDVADPRWCAPLAPEALGDALVGRRVERLGRRGKYLLWEAGDEVTLALHLRMTGTLLYDPPADTPYRRVTFTLDDGHELWFCDPRRFGTGELAVGAEALHGFLDARLGVEPLGPDFTTERLRLLARGRRAPVKAFLLDQRRIAGVGNIYADEALFRARIHPLTPAGRLKRAQLAALHDAVRLVLHAGIDAGGSTIDDFRHADGVRGSFQHEFLVHTRRGEPCTVCGDEIVKLVAAGRGTCLPDVSAPAAWRARPPAPDGALNAGGGAAIHGRAPRPPASRVVRIRWTTPNGLALDPDLGSSPQPRIGWSAAD